MKKPGKSSGGAPQMGHNVMPKQPETSGDSHGAPFGSNKPVKAPKKTAGEGAPQFGTNDLHSLTGGKTMKRDDDTRKERKL